ncbi:MAG: hypothetical protein ACLUEQ_03300 [Cloacibacillus evryensis]
MDEVAERNRAGERWIVVHGASGVMNDLCAERGLEVRMVTSPSGYRSRFVGERERELFREAALSYGARIIEMLAERSVKPSGRPGTGAIRGKAGFSAGGVNGRMRILRGNYSGVTKVNRRRFSRLSTAGSCPSSAARARLGARHFAEHRRRPPLAQIAGAVKATA